MGGWLSRWRRSENAYEAKKKELEEVDQHIKDALSARKSLEDVRRARLKLLLFLFIMGLIFAILNLVFCYLRGKLSLKVLASDWTLVPPFVVLPIM